LDSIGVFKTLTTSTTDIGIVLEYPDQPAESGPVTAKITRQIIAPCKAQKLSRPVEYVDVIGAGNFARTMLLPTLKDQIPFGTVVNQTALSGNHVKTKFGFREASTNSDEVLQQSSNSATIISTRHNLHAPLVLKALKANRQIFVEKPLCLTLEELKEIDAAAQNSNGTIQIGFNRRFAPASQEIKTLLSGAPGPMSVTYRVMAGKLDPAHWFANIAESGGRVIGESCHMLDYCCFLFDSDPVQVQAQTTWPASGKMPFPDSVCAQVEFANGSCAQIDYSAQGDAAYPKESFTLFASGMVIEVFNYLEMHIYRGRKKSKKTFGSKGHAEQMEAWLRFLKGQTEHPFPYEKSRVSMLLTFAVLQSIQQGRTVRLSEIA
jgi:predicted dehydrogenase